MRAAYDRSMWANWARKKNCDYFAYISLCIDDYIHKLEHNDLHAESSDVSAIINEQIKVNLDVSKRIAGGVKTTVQHYLDGKPSAAYESLASSLRPSLDVIKVCSTKYIQNRDGGVQNFFRLRVSESKREVMSRKDIFHVPFEKRSSIHSNRYSIPGLPCLYLGASLYTCWEEMNRPDFDSIFFSRFSISVPEKITIFNVGYETPSRLYERMTKICQQWNSIDEKRRQQIRLPEQIKDIVDRLMLWPLTLACSIPTISEHSAFYPEYIVPQLLMQFIAETDEFHAMMYRTTMVPSENIHISPHLLLNFAFPTKTIKPRGFCDTLQSFFELTEPMSWELAIASHPALPLRSISNSEKNSWEELRTEMKRNEQYLAGCEFSPIKNTCFGYGHSDFGKLENYSIAYPAEPLQ